MSKVPVNGDEAEIRNILESIWEMAAEEQQEAAAKTGKDEGKKSSPSKDLILSPKGPSLSGLDGAGKQNSDRRPLSEALRGVQLPTGGNQNASVNGSGKPVKHLRPAFAASSNTVGAGSSNSAPTGAKAQVFTSSKTASPAAKDDNRAASPPAAPARSGEPEVERKMAPFLDTRMNRMAASAPVSSSVSKPRKPAPVSPPPAAPIMPTVPAASDLSPVVQTAPPAPTTPVVHAVPAAPAAAPTPSPAVSGADRVAATPHDAAAEMLRPVLRQWLGDNMPRIVETALQIEVAESLKPPQKGGG